MAQPEFIEVQKFLTGVGYPASKDELIEHARGKLASQDVLKALEDIPDGSYDGPDKVSQSVAR
ncbi:MAG TPA: DUF2795 domain-containing protein [Trebonia sp.]|jgi:hypothetical protein